MQVEAVGFLQMHPVCGAPQVQQEKEPRLPLKAPQCGVGDAPVASAGLGPVATQSPHYSMRPSSHLSGLWLVSVLGTSCAGAHSHLLHPAQARDAQSYLPAKASAGPQTFPKTTLHFPLCSLAGSTPYCTIPPRGRGCPISADLGH